MSEKELYIKNKDNIEEMNEDNPERKKQINKGITLELGDIIEIHAPSNAELHTNTFFITYLDDAKMRLANVSTFHPYVLRMDENGRITDETVTRIILLNRSDETGYARQHLLLPKTWVDIRFGGEVPTIITGEITDLVEDMIEITTYPDVETIYIDFEYKGIPETIPLEQIVIRTKPASLDKIASLLDVRDQMEEGEIFEPGELLDDASEMAYMETGEAIIKLPKSAHPSKTVRDNLHTMYSSAASIIYGEELEDIIQRVEIPENQKRFGIETQTNDMLDELLSEIPNSKRSKAVLDNIHNLIEKFRELRSRFSKFDANGNVFDTQTLGMYHKPLSNHLLTMDTKLKWLIPVVALRRKAYLEAHPDGIDDISQFDISAVLGKDYENQEEYGNNQLRGDTPAYNAYYNKIDQSMTPIEPPQFLQNFLAPHQTIATQIEAVVKNLEDFYSTVVHSPKIDQGTYMRTRFVIQKYNLGHSKLAPAILPSTTAKVGRRVYVREPMTPNDEMTIASMLVLPISSIQFSQVDLPGSSILTKSALSQHYMYLFRILHDKSEVETRVVEQFNQDLDADFWGEEAEKQGFMKKIQEFVLGEALEQDPQRYKQFLNAMVPKTNAIIKLLTKKYPNHLSMKRVSDLLEPFLVYATDLTYYQYNDVRFLIKTGIKEYRVKFAKRGEEMAAIRSMHYQNAIPTYHHMDRIFFEKKELFDLLVESYKIPVDKRDKTEKINSSAKVATLTSGEWMSKLLRTDSAQLFGTLVQHMMISLIMPDNLAEALNEQVTKTDDQEETYKHEKIKATDCARRMMTKRYTSIKALQKDNGEDEIYYDAEFDDSPYELLDKYKADQKKYSSEEFVDFLAENLIQKHDCPPKMAKELAATLIAKKKTVKEGEYAIVEIRPHLPDIVDESHLTEKEKRDMKMEADIRKKTMYYRRLRKQWVHDDTVDEFAFIDSNTMFCNMDKICFKDMKSKVCEPIQDAEERMRHIARKKMLGEFDSRYVKSVEILQDELREQVEDKMHMVKKLERLKDVQRHKANNLAFEMGRSTKPAEIVQSPHIGLRDKILSQDDFIKRQMDIVRFVATYCRDPMVDELGESFYWLYCTETNTPLLPSFLFELAKAFTSGEDYTKKLGELRRKQGVLSDDGDSIVDRFSGYIICKIDSVQEDGYDEDGRKIVTNDVIEKDAGMAFVEAAAAASKKQMKDRVFENETAEIVFKVYSAISQKIGLPLDSVEDFVMRVSLEIIGKNVDSEPVYKTNSEKILKDTGKNRIPYTAYLHQFILAIVSAMVLVSVQTATPSFKIRKTFPGCVQSFRGFPMGNDGGDGGGVEDTTGLRYMACVLNTLKSSISPWNAIQKIPIDIIQSRIRSIIDKIILLRLDLTELYVKKREYLLLHPEEDIPKEHAIQKWTGFLPPVVEFSVAKQLRGLTEEYKQELLTGIRNGNKETRNQIAMFRMKSTQYGYSLIENIRTIVRSKDLLLKTASNVFFMENACCNDRNTARIMDYFAHENETILPHIKMVEGWSAVLDSVHKLSRASILFDPKRTGIIYPAIPTEHFEDNIYAAFIYYCNLDRDLPIPEEMRGLIAEKIPDYDPKWILAEKIEHLKKHGKRFTLGNLTQLMEIVNRRNRVQVNAMKLKGTPVSALSEFLEHLNSRDETVRPVIVIPLQERLAAVLAKYNPRSMVAEINDETKRLNNYLTKANEQMLFQITDFFEKHGKLNARKLERLQKMMSDIHMWNLDPTRDDMKIPEPGTDETSMYTVMQFMRNSVYSMSRVYPEIIRNNHSQNTKAAKHWGLSYLHNTDITNFLLKYGEGLKKFKNDPILTYLLADVQLRLVDLNIFLQNIPAFTPIHRAGEGERPPLSYFSLFDKRTLYMLYTYSWYSVLYEYIQATDDPDMLRMDIHERKEMRRHQNRENADQFALGMSEEAFEEDNEMVDMGNDMIDVQIVAGNQIELKSRVAEMLLVFLEIDETNKEKLDMSYSELEKRVNKSKLKEKKIITDFLKDMDADARRVEDLKKTLKLGRWNVGMRAGLVNYDQARYDEERQEFINQMINGEEEEGAIIQRDVNDLDLEDDADAENAGDEEANDIRGLGEDYRDGEYYEEDIE